MMEYKKAEKEVKKYAKEIGEEFRNANKKVEKEVKEVKETL